MTTPSTPSIQQKLWSSRIPLHITHSAIPTTPFITSIPRFSYLALLLPRLSAFFGSSCSSFHFEEVQLRNLAVGLLADLYQPTLPWKLTVSDGVEWDVADTFLNSVKEADFIRNGNANQIMKMSKEHTTQLWHAFVDNDYASFSPVQTRLLNTATALRHIPIRFYIPSPPPPADAATADSTATAAAADGADERAATGSYKVIQSLVPAVDSSRRPQTLGQAVKGLMPRLFPSSRDPILANLILHGAPAPFVAPLQELMKDAAYPDGWLCFVITV